MEIEICKQCKFFEEVDDGSTGSWWNKIFYTDEMCMNDKAWSEYFDEENLVCPFFKYNKEE